MEPRIVERAENAPGQCLVSQDIEGPFIDTGNWAPWVEPYVYLSASYVEGLARDLLGMVPASEVEALRAAIEAQGVELDRLRHAVALVDELEETMSPERERAAA